MKRSLLFLVAASLFSSLAAQSPYTVSGGSGIPLAAVNNTQNRLEVYLLNGLSGAKISFPSSDPHTQWYRYDKNNNANNAVPVPSFQDGNTSYITDVQDGYGYFVGQPTEALPNYVWIIDYSKYVPRFYSLAASEDEFKCTSLTILADVEADPLTYYLPVGAPTDLPRTYHLQYSTQEWTDDSQQFLPIDTIMDLHGLISEVTISPPLADTYFTLTGDDFASYFGMQQTIRSSEYQAVAVEAHYTAVTNKEHADNEVHHAGDILGGSAPVNFTFTAFANEPVAGLYIWKISQQDSITGALIPKVRYPEKVLQFDFDQNGTYQVQLEVSDVQSVCVDTTQSFTVIIDNTLVKIPNAFSPGSSIGINDELRVAFTSVLSFKASVYNRWGNLLFQWSDPSKGWDGRVSGKFVPTGVYFVIVEYKDSNGKNRTASQAVNVLREGNGNNITNQ